MITNNTITKKTLNTLAKITGTTLTLGKLIYSIRRGEELTQVEFAKLLNISTSHLCDIEHDRKIVSPKLSAKYAKILGYDEEQFIRLALQAILDKAELKYNIELGVTKPKVKSTRISRINGC